MSQEAQHPYSPPPLYLRLVGITGCRICGQDANAPVHPADLKPLLLELRNTARRVEGSMPRVELAQAEMAGRIRSYCAEHGASYTLAEPMDYVYYTVYWADFVNLLRRHYFKPFYPVDDIGDCDKVHSWVRAWGAMLRFSAIVRVKDLTSRNPNAQGRAQLHVYDMLVLADRTVLFDGGLGIVVQPGQGALYPFKDVELEF